MKIRQAVWGMREVAALLEKNPDLPSPEFTGNAAGGLIVTFYEFNEPRPLIGRLEELLGAPHLNLQRFPTMETSGYDAKYYDAHWDWQGIIVKVTTERRAMERP